MATQKKAKIGNFAGHKGQSHGHTTGSGGKPLPAMNKGGAGKSAGQPSGHGMSIPERSNPVKDMGIGKAGNGGGIFKTSGKVLINSGVSGAHRLGCKK
jgi:hypothetical protein